MGRYRHTVDAKGRIFLPSKMREEIGASVYVTKSLDPECLSGYTQMQFAEIRSQLSRLPDDHALQAFVRFKQESRREEG